MPQILYDQDVQGIASYAAVRDNLAVAFTSLAAGRAAVLPRQRIDVGGVKFSTMGAVWAEAGVAGEKSYATVDGRFSFVTTLWDTTKNLPLVVFVGEELTRLRTPALAALVVQKAAHRTESLALFGAGVQGRSHLEALLSLHAFHDVRVVDPAAELEDLCRTLTAAHGVRVRAASADEAVDGADVVVTTTRSKRPVFDGRRLAPGSTVIAMGVSLPDGRELDDATLSRAGRIGVEFKPQSLVEAGDVVLGLASGAIDLARIHDLSDFLIGRQQWRADPDELVVFKSVGVGLADVATAKLLWDQWSTQRGLQ